MASSQAACIHLFAPVLLKPGIANQILPTVNRRFRSLATDYLENGFRFEYWDESNRLKDHSAAAGTDSDIAIAYFDTDGDLSLWLIEHKLAEDSFTSCGGFRSRKNATTNKCRNCDLILDDPSQCFYTYECGYKYWEITRESALYRMEKLRDRDECPFIGGGNQLCRNQLMGWSALKNGVFKKAHFSVVYHHGNEDLQGTVSEYSETLSNQAVFSSITSREIIESAGQVDDRALREWAEWFSYLYRV